MTSALLCLALGWSSPPRLTSQPQLDAAGSSSLLGLYVCNGNSEVCSQPTKHLLPCLESFGLTSNALSCLHSKSSQLLDLVCLALSCQKNTNNCRVKDSPGAPRSSFQQTVSLCEAQGQVPVITFRRLCQEDWEF